MKKISLLWLLLMLLTLNISIISAGEGEMEKATFAGGCFWCMEAPFEQIDGVKEVISGYTGGTKENPTYEEVSAGKTGHFEAIQVTYDPARVSYKQLLDIFWRQIDPADTGGQFADRGPQYQTAIFYHNEEQKKTAQQSKEELASSGKFPEPIVTKIIPAAEFYKAENYHQDYYKRCPIKYNLYKQSSGREQFIEEKWANPVKDTSQAHRKPSPEELKNTLTPLQYKITQENCTEPAFQNEYWDSKREGIYVDVVSGEVLFSSLDKFDSGTGWPSFTQPLEPENIVEKEDRSLATERREVRSRQGDSHLGHIFPDGPQPGGLRYCINSAALRFIPKEDLEKEGYGKYKKLFE